MPDIPAPAKRQPFVPLSPEALKRLQKNERSQASETKRQGLPVEFVSVEALWILQRGRCACPNCGKLPMDQDAAAREPDAIVIAHVYYRKRGGGHTIENVRLWRHACNAAMAAIENHDGAVGDRMAVDFTKRYSSEPPKPSRWAGRGFRKDIRRKMNGTVERVSDQ